MDMDYYGCSISLIFSFYFCFPVYFIMLHSSFIIMRAGVLEEIWWLPYL